MDIPTDFLIAPGGRLDVLAILFLLGSLTLLWALWVVIRDDSPLTLPESEGDV